MFLIGLAIGLMVSPFLILATLTFRSEPKRPLTKEEWRQIDD